MNVSPLPQPVNAPLTRAALFLVVTVNPGVDQRARVRSLLGDLASLVRAVGFRAMDAGLSCVLASPEPSSRPPTCATRCKPAARAARRRADHLAPPRKESG